MDGVNARVFNSGDIQSQVDAVKIIGNTGRIANGGTLSGRDDAAEIIGTGGVIRNSGIALGANGLIISGSTGTIINSGTVDVSGTAMRTSDEGCTIRNTESGRVISSSATGAAVIMSVFNSGPSVFATGVFVNAGTINSTGTGVSIDEGGATGASDDTSLRVANRGTISGDDQALLLSVDSATVINSGTMTGTHICIKNALAGPSIVISNEGTLQTNSVVSSFGQIVRGSAIVGNTGSEVLFNTGTIFGSVFLKAGFDRVTNDGLIVGRVDLGDASDFYDGSLGRVNGSVLGGAGDDQLTGGAFADTMDGGADNDTVESGLGADRLAGSEGADSVSGEVGNDVLFGSEGADTLIGGSGADSLTGGEGADVFVLLSAAETGLGATTRDVITDFAVGVDDLQLTFMNSFIGAAGFTAAGQVRYVTASGILSGSTDADASSEWQVQMATGLVLTSGDFVF